MQRIEDFLQDYFQGRTEMQRSLGKLYGPLAARFLAPSYVHFNHRKSVADSEAERILSVQTTGTTAEVITCGWLGADHRTRYRLSADTDSWKIAGVEIECGVCHGSGKWKDQQSDCRICKGKGWTSIGEKRDT